MTIASMFYLSIPLPSPLSKINLKNPRKQTNKRHPPSFELGSDKMKLMSWGLRNRPWSLAKILSSAAEQWLLLVTRSKVRKAAFG